MGVRTLSIGRVTLDQYFRGGEHLGTFPGGSAYNVAQWFDDAGFESALAGTLGKDFPIPDGIDTSLCRSVDSNTFRVTIQLTEEGGEISRTENDRGYASKALDQPDDQYDIVGLYSFENPLLELFEGAHGSIKVYDPGEMTDDYEWTLLERGFATADHAFLNEDEEVAVRELSPCSIDRLPSEYGIESLVTTSEESVTVYRENGSKTFAVNTVDSPVDTVGAGDAFASRYVEGLVHDEPLRIRVEEALQRAKRTVGHVSALPERVWRGQETPTDTDRLRSC